MNYLFLFFVAALFAACSTSSGEQDKEIESLHKELIKGHDEVMPLSMQLPKLKEKVLAHAEETEADDVDSAQILSLALTKANDDMYTWMDDFAEAMKVEDKAFKISAYKRLQDEISVIGEDTREAMKDAKLFLNEE
jgi:hypothetical protein